MFIIWCLNLTCKYDMILQNGRFAKNIDKISKHMEQNRILIVYILCTDKKHNRRTPT